VEDKDYFVITSNCDRQFMRTGFPMNRVFEAQGSYDRLRCIEGCTRETFDIKPFIDRRLPLIDTESFMISDESAIPACPYCGAPLFAAVREFDAYKIEQERYIDWLESTIDKKLCIIELGVGFNTPVVIRWPFERLTFAHENAPGSEAFLKVQDENLSGLIAEQGITDADTLPPTAADPRLVIWKGDITTLQIDAIVNAANSRMEGCWQPCHACIDNCIHTYSGVQLRLRCHELMMEQGTEEPTGSAKITPGYNLPATYVLHTVGPIIDHPLTERDCALLASCYTSCLKLAAQNGCRSVAFCCISTGVFRFPQDKAAEIAVQTVREFLKEASVVERVVFNVFNPEDERIYRGLLG
jgi:O-acetyl-ADP-ribose deacetylase (regulator of RNase III)